jgi:hypothetical protein
VPSRSAALPLAFVAGSLTAWLIKQALLQTVAEPLARSFRESPCSQHSISDQIPSFINSYSWLALTGGALLALPFGTQLLAARLNLQPRVKRRTLAAGFVAISYLLELLGVAVVSRVAPPLLLARLIGPTGWCGDNWSFDTTSAIQWYVARACLVAGFTALVLELCLAALWFKRRATDR